MEESVNDSAKEVCGQVQDSMPMSQFANSETSFECQENSSKISNEKKQGVFQVQDVVTHDDHMIFVVETPDFVVPDSLLPSQNPVEKSNWDLLLEKKASEERMIGSDETYCRVWGESLASGSKEMVAEIGIHIVNGTCSIGLGEKGAGVCSENITQEVVIQKKCSRRKCTETNLKKNVLSMFAEAKNVGKKKLDGSKLRYSRSEMEMLRFENSDQQRQIWREIYTGLGPIVTKELNCSAEDKQKGNASTDQQQQHHHRPKQNHQHPRQKQQHQQCPPQQQHQKLPQKPHQHHHHQQAGVNIENSSILGAATAMGRPIHLRINMKNSRTNCNVPYVHYIPVYHPISL
ncbi:hypothetical protein MKX01_028666 [Papaver californicum]|nr:hypothetical protein MKX01_028666 [Papaver californicum]